MILSKMLPQCGSHRLRPLVWSAGAALTAVGAVYIYQWYYRPTPQDDDLPIAADGEDLSTAETPQAINEENGTLVLFMYSPLYCGPVTIYRGVSETSGQLLPWRYSPLYCGPVVPLSEVSETSGQLLPWRYSPLYCGPVALFSEVSETSGQLLPWRYSPLYCGPVVLLSGLPESGPLALGDNCNQFTFQFSFRTHFEQFLVKTRHIWMTRGPITQLWWSDLVERIRVNPQGVPVYSSRTEYVTGVKLVGAAVERFVSYSSQQNTHFTQFDGFLEQNVTWEHSGFYVDPCGQVFPSSWTNTQSFYYDLSGHTHGPGYSHDTQHASGQGHGSGHQHSQGASGGPGNTPRPDHASGPRHDHSFSHAGHASSQQEPEEKEEFQEEDSGDDYAEGEESHQAPPPGNRNASRLMMYLQMKQVQDMTRKIGALRVAFNSVLTQDSTKNFLVVAGRMILSGLVQLNQADASSACASFDRLVSYVEDPAHRAAIERELDSVNIHHANFLDIVYDLILLGLMKDNAPLPPLNGQGFLGHLFQVLDPILSPATGWEEYAHKFLQIIQFQLMDLLDYMLAQDEVTFSQADVLSAVLFKQLEEIIQQLLESLDDC